MTLEKAERVFHTLAQTDDKELLSLLAEWDPTEDYDHVSDDYGVLPQLREYGIEPRARATLKHDQIVSLGVKAASAANLSAAASAFVCSIAINDPQRVRWLIPLRAISNTLHLPQHRYQDDDGNCFICGEAAQSTWELMWAMSSLSCGDCGEDWELFDNIMMVRWFNGCDTPKVRREDSKLFQQVINFIASADDELPALKLAKQLKRQFKGVEDTWRLFFETLGFAGVLKTDKHPGHLQQWTDKALRARPLGRGDARSPMCYWKRKFGFNTTVFEQLFPSFTLPPTLRARETEQ